MTLLGIGRAWGEKEKEYERGREISMNDMGWKIEKSNESTDE